jgi:DnaJ-class molecular chaperone
MIIFIAVVLVVLCLLGRHEVRSTPSRRGVMVSRSAPMIPRPDTAFCGNCHGTGDEGFGIMPDSAGDCEACDGRGYIKIDPNAKWVTLSEAMRGYEREEKNETRGSGGVQGKSDDRSTPDGSPSGC